MSTPRYTRPRDRTFAAIFGFILAVVVVVIEFLSHSRGVGQSFDTDEIFSRFRAPLHFACKKTHVLERKKKAARFEEKWSRRERGNARTGSKKGVARTSPGDAIICAAFLSVVVVVLLLAKRRAFLCCGVRKFKAQKKNVLGQKTKRTKETQKRGDLTTSSSSSSSR